MTQVLLKLLAVGAFFLAAHVTPALTPALAQAQMPARAEPSADGLWENLDDSGRPEGWFRIGEKNGVYEGILVKAFPKPGEDPSTWICSKCEGAEKDAPVIGLTLIKGMRRNGRSYEDGTIMDPRDGSVWRAQMKVSPDGQKLEVRGYLGVPWLGKSQIWSRLPDNALDPAPAKSTTPRRTDGKGAASSTAAKPAPARPAQAPGSAPATR